MQLNKNDVHVWKIDINLHLNQRDELFDVLDENEKIRAKRFRFEKDQRVFIISHGILRNILSKYLKCAPCSVAFSFGEHKKPSIPQSTLKFNLSHSHSFALVAVTWNDDIGVDVENVNQKADLDGIVDRFFSHNEVKEYFSLSKEKRLKAFYNGWTRKEAFIKATGKGLFQELKSFSVRLTPGKLAKVISVENDNATEWRLHSVKVLKDYAAAVCWKGSHKKILNYKF